MDAVQIKKTLEDHFKVFKIEVEDDSGRHKRHKESQGKGGHFNLFIVSNDFENLDLISRHRKIYEVLGMKDATLIHALSISALTEQEWKKKV